MTVCGERLFRGCRAERARAAAQRAAQQPPEHVADVIAIQSIRFRHGGSGRAVRRRKRKREHLYLLLHVQQRRPRQRQHEKHHHLHAHRQRKEAYHQEVSSARADRKFFKAVYIVRFRIPKE